MATTAQLRYSPLNSHHTRRFTAIPHVTTNFTPGNTFQNTISLPSLQCRDTRRLDPKPKFYIPHAGGGDGGNNRGANGGWNGDGDSDESRSSSDGFGPIGAFVNGWRSRVAADPQFPFKVLMEEVVGVSSCVLGDMASRPNFGLNELDFVFSTLVVGSIMNFVLMYLLAPTMSSSAQTLPSIFASSPTSHMFEPGAYTLLSRVGTFVYKGTLFAAVGFAAGLAGTALSNGLIQMRKKMDPKFETPNKPPPPVLNALTWAIHMGLSSNFRYQALNGMEFLLDKGLSPFLFKTSVVFLRCFNNVLGGVSFVVLARLTGSQSQSSNGGLTQEKEKLMISEEVDDDFETSSHSSK
ncbi:hypothetical protein ACJIZ3_022240 [Penstemon smallii]|uniref:Uncharacterized protein n=1 Tax=Penstemon smallii TaxID=265156 RepID=A0ABD3SPC4_9LAMI